MPQDVAAQVDLSALSIRGLAAFTPLLSALSADDVAPLAMVQLENLGSPYHTNGQYALMVPDLLRRCSSVRMDRVGVMIGWRKGDTASFLAQSAGGQAIALLCFCLANTCKHQDIGPVLHDLSNLILPNNLAVSSIAQLTVVADLLAAKLQVIGFGNLIAEQVVRIQKVYSHIGKRLPPGFFDAMTRESTVELYHALSKLSSEESTVLRISGLHAMGHIMMVALIMFPDNVTILTDSLLIQQGHSPSIFLDINTLDSEQSTTMIRVEERLDVSSISPILMEIIPTEFGGSSSMYSFKWTGHVADALRIALANFGVDMSEALVEACCDLLLCLIRPSSKPLRVLHDDTNMPLNGYFDLIGSEPIQRCYHVCRIVFGAVPRSLHHDIRSAFTHLAKVFDSVIGSANSCTCSGERMCDISDGWGWLLDQPQNKAQRNCLHRTLWRVLVSALNRAYCAMLIDAGPQVTTVFDIGSVSFESLCLPSIEEALKGYSHGQPESWSLSCERMHEMMMFMLGSYTSNALAVSNNSSTIYPTSLSDLQLDVDRGFRYNLEEGQIHVKGRRYRQMVPVPTKARQKASKALLETKSRIRPSYSGEHSHIDFTIRESLYALELRTTVLVQGHSIQIDLCQVICSSMGLNDAPECPHNPKIDLSPGLYDDVRTTSVAMPGARHNKIAIVQTKDNPTAQLLACEPGSRSLLQRKCCLDCAVLYAKTHRLSQIIVAS